MSSSAPEQIATDFIELYISNAKKWIYNTHRKPSNTDCLSAIKYLKLKSN